MHGKDKNRAFAGRLRAALERAGVRGPTQLALKFNLRYDGQPVSTQAAHKWLNGDALPADDKILTLAGWLGIDPNWLRYGTPEDMKQIGSAQSAPRYDLSAEDAALLQAFHGLDAAKKRLVKALLRALSQTM
jgi:transcriptional regulator with XRE-family HTH domain